MRELFASDIKTFDLRIRLALRRTRHQRNSAKKRKKIFFFEHYSCDLCCFEILLSTECAHAYIDYTIMIPLCEHNTSKAPTYTCNAYVHIHISLIDHLMNAISTFDRYFEFLFKERGTFDLKGNNYYARASKRRALTGSTMAVGGLDGVEKSVHPVYMAF